MAKEFVPEWKGAIEGYTVNYLSKQYWRVQETMSWDQAMAEGQFIFAKVLDRYPHVDNPRWFMALYKRLLANRIHTLSHEASFYRGIESLEALNEEEESEPSTTMVEYNEGYLLCLMEQAPDEIQELLSILFEAPTEVFDSIRAAWRERKGSKRKTNVVLCELVGKDPSRHDLVGQLRRYFT